MTRRASPVGTDKQPPARTPCRGSYLSLAQAAEIYPVFSERLLRRLVQERRIAFTRAGRTVVLADSDIQEYLERNRVEAAAPPSRWRTAS